MPLLDQLKIRQRHFLPNTFVINTWKDLNPFYENLLKRNINSVEDLKKWFIDRSELEAAVEEDAAWRYIKMTCDTNSQEKLDAYTYYVNEIEPQLSPFTDQLNKKAVGSDFIYLLSEEKAYDISVKLMKKDIQIFRDANVSLKAEEQVLAQKFAAISGAMSISYQDKELTMQQAGALLEEQDRKLREKIFQKMAKRRMAEKDRLHELFDQLIANRHQIAQNADFNNYRDYMFASLGRMDYSPKDCFTFHRSVKEETVPLFENLAKERKSRLNVDTLKPWDLAVDPTGEAPLKPFSISTELIEKTITCFNHLDPFFGDCLKDMHSRGFMDLDSRKGKAPGGYNYPLAESGAPFIFMNSSATLNDLVTMIHEGGHAIHSYLMRDLELNMFRQIPSEVAELASMSMELLSMDHWGVFFKNEKDLKRAKKDHLEQIIATLPWVATIDKFQHWIYENPEHQIADRDRFWESLLDDYGDQITDWSGLEDYRKVLWQKQLHLFEVPFYYIEYGFAQLGALAMWKNYKENPTEAISKYIEALQLGYSKPIPEIYETAGIEFNFTKEYIRELMEFLNKELNKLS